MLFVLFFGCQEEQRPEIIMDTVPPSPVTDVQVRNIPGGAVLKYQLPDDEDLLYVKAVYSLKEGDHQAEVRASLYNDSLVINGFGNEDEREVKVVAVDRSTNESTPETVTVKPLEPPVLTVRKTLRMASDFGGIHINWENLNRAEISVVLEMKDHNGEYVPYETFYSSVVEGDIASRGMDTVPYDFRVYVQDRWENQSPPLDTTLTPMFEMKFDRTKFRALYLTGDEPAAWGWVLPRLFDGNVNTGFHTETTYGTWPQWASFDMGVKGKISRIKVWQRPEDAWLYAHNNLKRFEIWGTNDVNNYNEWSVWTKLMTCVSIKPSGLPLGQLSNEDREFARAGEEFTCSIDAPACRYMRLVAMESWSGAYAFHIMEIEVYGRIEE
jgi:hypothetical protein